MLFTLLVSLGFRRQPRAAATSRYAFCYYPTDTILFGRCRRVTVSDAFGIDRVRRATLMWGRVSIGRPGSLDQAGGEALKNIAMRITVRYDSGEQEVAVDRPALRARRSVATLLTTLIRLYLATFSQFCCFAAYHKRLKLLYVMENCNLPMVIWEQEVAGSNPVTPISIDKDL